MHVKMPLSGTKVDRCYLITMVYDEILPPPEWQVVGLLVGWRRDSGRRKHVEEGDSSGLGPEVPF